jgi:preprotein translocase subunit SecG
MSRTVRILLLTVVLLALTAPLAFGAVEGHDAGEGLYGETNDKVITNAGFIVIAFFPLFVLTMSIIQWRLDVRKERRKEAAKARAARADLRAGY